MSDVVGCPSCGKRNRVPVAASGMPVCAACGVRLPWLVDSGDDSFDAAVDAPVPVIVDLWAPWCGPCRMISPALERLAAQHAGHLKVVKVNVDESPGVSRRFGVQSIPMLLAVVDGTVVDRQIGALPEAALASWVSSHLTARPT
jgi:thioredoxin 2